MNEIKFFVFQCVSVISFFAFHTVYIYPVIRYGYWGTRTITAFFLRKKIVFLSYLIGWCSVHVFYYWFHLVFKNCVGFQALIQYQSRQSAVAARSTLQVVLHLHGVCGITWLVNFWRYIFIFDDCTSDNL